MEEKYSTTSFIAYSTCILIFNLGELIVSSIFFRFHCCKGSRLGSDARISVDNEMRATSEAKRGCEARTRNELLEIISCSIYNIYSIHPFRYEVCKTKQIHIQKKRACWHRGNIIWHSLAEMCTLLRCPYYSPSGKNYFGEVWNGKQTWNTTTQMGITWETQQSTPTDALKVVFTLMSLAD